MKQEKTDKTFLPKKPTYEELEARLAKAEAIIQSQNLLKNLIDALPMFISYVDSNQRYQFVNKAYEDLYNCTSEEIKGQHIKERMGDKAYQLTINHVEKVLSGEKVSYEQLVPFKDGITLYLSINFFPHLSDNGKVIGFFVLVNDITKQKQMEELVRESEERYRSIITAISDGILFQTAYGLLQSLNTSAERILGLTSEQIEGRTPLDPRWKTIHEDGSLFSVETHPSIVTFRTGEPQTNVIMGVHKPNEGLAWVSVNTDPLFKDNKAKPYAVVISLSDITERKQAEDNLRFQSEIINNLAEGVYIIRASDGIIVYTNPKFSKMFGYDNNELIGKHVSILNAPTDKSPEETAKEIINVLNENNYWIGEICNIKKDGTSFWCHATVSIFEHHEYGTVWITIHTDITEQKQAEKLMKSRTVKLTQVVDQLQWEISERKKAEKSSIEQSRLLELFYKYTLDSIVLLDKDFNFIRVNEAYAKSCQRDVSEFPGHNHFEFYPSDFQKTAEEVVKSKKPFEISSRPFVFSDHPEWGTTYWDLALVPVLDKKGEIELLVFSLKDVTDHKKAEQELQKAHDELEMKVSTRTAELSKANQLLKQEITDHEIAEVALKEANKEIESFSYSVSHDLKAPLRAINGFSDILFEEYYDKLDDEGKRVLNIIKSSVEEMKQLIDDLLTLSRLGRKQMKLSDINIDKLVRSVFKKLNSNIPNYEIQLKIKNLPTAHGDSTLIRQVFVNLLSNAIKFTRHKKTAVIEIGCESKNDKDIYYVKDNGVGFEMEYIDKLFGVFQRLHDREEFEGTGVGLAIVERIIHRHGGKVWAEGQPNKGARFYFTLS